ncbi:MAG: hypothetical protein JO215_12400 [Ktedonobacteraceae bacterium]|nr:hypothetical protein [Ktedonobacteraceae bacterium]
MDLFDAQTSTSDQLEMLGSFLEERTQILKAANQAVRDVLVYFVGHGGFVGSSHDFYLLPHRANASSLRASGMAMDALAEVVREKARQARRYLFLDCCFAAAAFRAFQGGPDQTAITKTLDAFAVQARSSGFPRRGTTLLCSSDQKSPSLLLPDESCTMFSYALLDVLKNGDPYRSPLLSLRDIKELAEDRLATLPGINAPRPGLYSPDQSEGDVADIPLFPNPRAEETKWHQAEEHGRRIEDGLGISTPSGSVEFVLQHTLTRHSLAVLALAISPDGRVLVSSSRDKTMKIWQLHTGQLLGTIPGRVARIFSRAVSSLAIGGDGHLLASVDRSDTISLWELPSGKGLHTIKDEDHTLIQFVTFRPDGSILASSSPFGIKLWNPLTKELLRTLGAVQISQFEQAYDFSRSLAFSPDGRILASCGEGTIQLDSASSSRRPVIRLWNPDTRELLDTFVGYKRGVYSVAFSPDGQVLACYGDDGDDKKTYTYGDDGDAFTLPGDHPHPSLPFKLRDYSPAIKLWDCSTRQLVHTISLYSGKMAIIRYMEVGSAPFAFSPDGQILASAVNAMHNNTIKLWNWHTGALLQILPGDQGIIQAITFSPDGQTLVSASHNTIKIWGKASPLPTRL